MTLIGRKIACLLGCPDEADAARKCIAYASEVGDELDDCDVRAMRELLDALGYETHVIPRAAKDDTAVHWHLKEVARACARHDEFLFYFSGHGQYSNDRGLALTLGEDESFLGATLLDVLTKKCKAQRKLVILDCCFAGAIEHHWPEQQLDLHLLVAGTEGQRALHDPNGVGSFFTNRLICALTERSLRDPDRNLPLADGNGELRSDALIAWLREEMRLIGRQRNLARKRIPVPLALPRDVPFAIRGLHLEERGYSWYLCEELRKVVRGCSIEQALARQSWEYCRTRQSGTTLKPLEEDDPRASELFEKLLDCDLWYVPGDALRFPLITFTAHLVRSTDPSSPLRTWLDEAVHWLRQSGFPREEVLAAESLEPVTLADAGGVTQAVPATPCLLIDVARHTGRDRYRLSWDLIDEHGDTVRKEDPGPPVGRGHLADTIAKITWQLASDTRGRRVEIALPAQLLSDEHLIERLERLPLWDGVHPAAESPLGPGHLAHERALVFRCWERWGGTPQDAVRYAAPRYRDHFEARSGCLAEPPEPPCLKWVGHGARADPCQQAASALTAAAAEDRPLAIALRQCPDDQLLDRLLCTGVPILLWPGPGARKDGQAGKLKRELPQRCAKEGLAGLPRALLEYRRHCAASSAGSPLYAPRLLWDTPERLKYDQPDDTQEWAEPLT